MSSVHTTVTVLAFNGFEHGMVGTCFFVRIPKWGRGSLKDVYSSLRQVKTLIPGEDK